MPIKFKPNYQITPKIASCLMRIETAKEKVSQLPLNPTVLTSLRETARLYTTHYSTMIEGNRLDPEEIRSVLKHEGHFPGRERDEHEVQGYYTALHQVEKWANRKTPVTETMIQTIHALVMANGRNTIKKTPYRDSQNVIRDSLTRTIVYMPPEAKDVPLLMKELILWLQKTGELPSPIVAAIAHYQFATIHPYFDGNGRTARLLTTLLLHLADYDLKGLYSLEEYYARDLGGYYKAISIGPSHNYYLGRAEADITPWIEYFIEGMAISSENVLKRMAESHHRGDEDQAALLRRLTPQQRKALELFQESEEVTANQLGELFGYKARTSSGLCKKWVEEGFLEVVNPSKKARKYRLKYTNLS